MDLQEADSPRPLVLVADDEGETRRALKRLLGTAYEVVESENVTSTLDQVGAHGSLSAIVLDLWLPDGSGLDVLKHLNERGWEVPTVVLSGHLSPATFAEAMDLGAVRILEKGGAAQDLLEAVAFAIECGAGTRGSLHGLSLVDILQMFYYARRTVRVHVLGALPGRIDMAHGEIVHAETAAERGVDALRGLLSRYQAALRTSPLPEVEDVTIEAPFEGLLLDCLRQVDEASHEAEMSTPSFFPVTSEPPPVPASIGTWGEKPVLDRLGPVLESTIGRLTPGASVVHAGLDGEVHWVAQPPVGEGLVVPMLAVLPSILGLGEWTWMVRTDASTVSALIRVASDSLAIAIAPRIRRSTQGQLVAGVIAAAAQLQAMAPISWPAAPDWSTSPETHLLSPSLEQRIDALRRQGARAVRFLGLDADGWLAHRHLVGEPPPEGLWHVGRQLLVGPLGGGIAAEAARTTQLSTDEAEVEVMVATADHLAFGRRLPHGKHAILVSSAHHPRLIGPLSVALRRHDFREALPKREAETASAAAAHP